LESEVVLCRVQDQVSATGEVESGLDIKVEKYYERAPREGIP